MSTRNNVGFTHSFTVILCGYVFKGGNWNDPFPWLVSLPLFIVCCPPSCSQASRTWRRIAWQENGPCQYGWDSNERSGFCWS